MARPCLLWLLLVIAGAPAWAEQYVVLDPGGLAPESLRSGAGLDGAAIDPRAVAEACRRAAVKGPAAFATASGTCRPLAALPGLRSRIGALAVAEAGTPVLEHVAAGGVAAVEPTRGVACVPGACPRRVLPVSGYTGSTSGPPQAPPPAPAITRMTVDPVSLTAGETATVSWSATGVSTCTLGDSGTGESRTVPATGSQGFAPAVDTAWTLTCSGAGGSTFAQAIAEVTPPPQAPEIVFFAPTLKEVVAGEGTTLRWETRFTESCALDDGGGVLDVPLKAIYPVTVPASTAYVLACESAVGSTARRAFIAANAAPTPPEIAAFAVSPATILRGANVIASWEVRDTEGCTLSDPVQRLSWRVAPVASLKLVPAGTTTYTLDCRNASGSDRASAAVTVTESDRAIRMTSFSLKPFSFTGRKGGDAGPARLAGPGLAQVDWTTEDASACQVARDGGGGAFSVPVNGSYVLWIDETTSLQANCASSAGEAQAFDQIQVLGEPVFFGDFEG